MSLKNKFYLKPLLWLLIGNLVAYLIHHLAYHINQYWFDQFATYVSDAWNMLMPAIGAVISLRVLSDFSLRQAAIYSLFISICRLVYSIPFNYLHFMTDFTSPSSLDSITTSLLVSAAEFVFVYLQIALLLAVGLLVMRWKKTKINAISGLMEKCYARDFTCPFTGAVFGISLVQLLMGLSVPISTTLQLIADHGIHFRTGEIIHIVLDCAFVLVLFVLCHILCCRIGRRQPEQDA